MLIESKNQEVTLKCQLKINDQVKKLAMKIVIETNLNSNTSSRIKNQVLESLPINVNILKVFALKTANQIPNEEILKLCPKFMIVAFENPFIRMLFDKL
jgi:ABC-type Fe3+-citrate transport system substrate-binding protein